MTTKRKTTKAKSRKRKSQNKINIRTRIISLIWSALIIGILTIITRNLNGCNDTANYGLSHIEHLDVVATADGIPEKIICYEGMNISFNPDLHIPNWVAWELTAEESLGDEPRAKNFACDESVDGCAKPWDYSYSGYDRGHMAPAGDMKWSRNAMQQSFYMTNICPQVGALNSGAWKRLEEKCRTWAQCDSAITIVAGPILTDNLTETIGESHVAVPKRFFKVIVSPYSKPPKGIAFIMNNGRVEGGLQNTATTIDNVEFITGHDFFQTLPDSFENEIESQCRFHYWSTLTPKQK